MFRIDQIMTVTTFLRSFREVANWLAKNNEPLLITQRNGRFIVVMDGEFFEGVMGAREQIRRAAAPAERDAQSGSVASRALSENARRNARESPRGL